MAQKNATSTPASTGFPGNLTAGPSPGQPIFDAAALRAQRTDTVTDRSLERLLREYLISLNPENQYEQVSFASLRKEQPSKVHRLKKKIILQNEENAVIAQTMKRQKKSLARIAGVNPGGIERIADRIARCGNVVGTDRAGEFELLNYCRQHRYCPRCCDIRVAKHAERFEQVVVDYVKNSRAQEFAVYGMVFHPLPKDSRASFRDLPRASSLVRAFAQELSIARRTFNRVARNDAKYRAQIGPVLWGNHHSRLPGTVGFAPMPHLHVVLVAPKSVRLKSFVRQLHEHVRYHLPTDRPSEHVFTQLVGDFYRSAASAEKTDLP